MRVCLNPAAEPGNVPRGDDLQPWPLARFTRAGWLREACGIGDCHLQDWPDPESTIHLVRQAVRKWRTGICLGESCWKTLGPAQMLIMRQALDGAHETPAERLDVNVRCEFALSVSYQHIYPACW